MVFVFWLVVFVDVFCGFLGVVGGFVLRFLCVVCFGGFSLWGFVCGVVRFGFVSLFFVFCLFVFCVCWGFFWFLVGGVIVVICVVWLVFVVVFCLLCVFLFFWRLFGFFGKVLLH